MADLLRGTDVRELIEHPGAPVVSIYLPTHRTRAEREQDPIRFKNLLDQAESGLVADGMRQADACGILAEGRGLLDSGLFWSYVSDGLAVFLAPGWSRVYRLPLRFPELVVVGDRFHVKPLLDLLTFDHRFFVLALSQHAVRLLEGSRHDVQQIDLGDVPTSLDEVLKYDDLEKEQQLHVAGRGSGGARAVFHGHGAGQEVDRVLLERWVRVVDDGVQQVLAGQDAPLVLAGVGYEQAMFRAGTRHRHVLAEGIEGNPEQLSSKQLHDRGLADRRAGRGRATRRLGRALPRVLRQGQRRGGRRRERRRRSRRRPGRHPLRADGPADLGNDRPGDEHGRGQPRASARRRGSPRSCGGRDDDCRRHRPHGDRRGRSRTWAGRGDLALLSAGPATTRLTLRGRASDAVDLASLDDLVVTCRACPRLVAWREQVGQEKRASFAADDVLGAARSRASAIRRPASSWSAWRPPRTAPTGRGGCSPATGPATCSSLPCTAPASLHNRRPSGVTTASRLDGARVDRPRALRSAGEQAEPGGAACVRPLPAARARSSCSPDVVVVLGAFGWQATLASLAEQGWQVPRPRPAFAHGAEVTIPGPVQSGQRPGRSPGPPVRGSACSAATT